MVFIIAGGERILAKLTATAKQPIPQEPLSRSVAALWIDPMKERPGGMNAAVA
jgi:hypothetical protein